IKTKLLIISDTHGLRDAKLPQLSADVAIHCGDLTEESKLEEFRTTLQLLQAIDAPLKLVIAGNHDFTLDESVYRQKAKELLALSGPNNHDEDSELIKKVYGDYGEARSLLTAPAAIRQHGIHFLDEGTHHFTLANGGQLCVYASPFTPSLGDWGFQYHQAKGHNFELRRGTDISITHGPPRGILDRTDGRERAGCPRLFTAVARSQPRIHCFGHIHEGWGAKLVAWGEDVSKCGAGLSDSKEEPSHLTAINNGESCVIEALSTLQRGKFDDEDTARTKELKARKSSEQRYCGASLGSGSSKQQTLFVNGAIQAKDGGPPQYTWLVEIDLMRAE
ncbi:Metallo-dependent phosphatase-like protein, partial [Coniella lustricola]